MKEIKLTQGKVAFVDDEDFEELNQSKWYANKGGNSFYAVRNSQRTNGSRESIKMHRVILNAPFGKSVDHKDHNGLNNQKDNIRTCTHQQNHMNRKCSRNSISGIKGVHFLRSAGKWRARIHIDGKSQFLGYYSTAKEAMQQYNAVAKKAFGVFACLNPNTEV